MKYTHEEIMQQQHDFLDYVEDLQKRVNEQQAPAAVCSMPEWKPTTQPPAKGTLVWVVFRKTHYVYMHVYNGDKDLEWADFEAYIETPIYQPQKTK